MIIPTYWNNDYLLSLRERHYGALPAENHSHIRVGEVVLLKSDQPRSQWSLAKIDSVYPDSEGVIRTVKVISKGQVSVKTIDKIVPLELSVPFDIPIKDPVNVGASNRPVRAAAQGSQRNWRDLIAGGHVT